MKTTTLSLSRYLYLSLFLPVQYPFFLHKQVDNLRFQLSCCPRHIANSTSSCILAPYANVSSTQTLPLLLILPSCNTWSEKALSPRLHVHRQLLLHDYSIYIYIYICIHSPACAYCFGYASAMSCDRSISLTIQSHYDLHNLLGPHPYCTSGKQGTGGLREGGKDIEKYPSPPSSPSPFGSHPHFNASILCLRVQTTLFFTKCMQSMRG